MTDKKQIDRITCHEIGDPFQANWRCHIYTKDGSHYEGEGFTEEKAKKAAMAVYNANKN